MITPIFKTLKELEVVAHYEHILTNSYARHLALGSLYEGLTDFADRLAEVTVRNGEELVTPTTLQLNWNDQYETLEAYIGSVRTFIGGYEIAYGNRLEVQNILSEVKEFLSKILYLLTLN